MIGVPREMKEQEVEFTDNTNGKFKKRKEVY